MDVKNKTIRGLFWSFSEQFANKFVHFIIGIILARLLTPADFGLVGMVSIFLIVSQTIANGGLSHALIRKKECKEIDFQTTFIANIITALIVYAIFYLSAPYIANFYDIPELTNIIRILFIVLIIDSFAFIQRTKIYKDINFQALAKINVSGQIISGILAIIMALKGYGVWSIVIRTIVNRFIITTLMIYVNKWTPKLKFSKSTFYDLLGFGYKMLINNLVERVYRRIYLLLIGKFFNAATLGFYTRADQFKNIISEQLTSTIQRVSLPILAENQENNNFNKIFKKLVKHSFLISSFLMLGLIVIAKPMILLLLGEKWSQSIPYLQIIALAGIVYPASELNINLLQIKKRSDIILKLQIFKKVLAIPIIIIGIILGIKYLLIGIVVISLIDYTFNSYYTKRTANYGTLNQIKDLLLYLFIFGGILGISFIIMCYLTEISNILQFIIISLFYSGSIILILEIIKDKYYIELKESVLKFLNRLRKR